MGGTLGQRVTPIKRVGVYVPGGTAPLPSSLLMAVIPAQVAGVAKRSSWQPRPTAKPAKWRM
jgi:histidinol dehydrogenase